MAKKKAEPKSAEPTYQTKNILALRGSPEYKAWLDELTEANKAPLALTTEQAYALLAAKLKVRKPPRRVP